MCGKEAALFLPSGTMGNLISSNYDILKLKIRSVFVIKMINYILLHSNDNIYRILFYIKICLKLAFDE